MDEQTERHWTESAAPPKDPEQFKLWLDLEKLKLEREKAAIEREKLRVASTLVARFGPYITPILVVVLGAWLTFLFRDVQGRTAEVRRVVADLQQSVGQQQDRVAELGRRMAGALNEDGRFSGRPDRASPLARRSEHPGDLAAGGGGPSEPIEALFEQIAMLRRDLEDWRYALRSELLGALRQEIDRLLPAQNTATLRQPGATELRLDGSSLTASQPTRFSVAVPAEGKYEFRADAKGDADPVLQLRHRSGVLVVQDDDGGGGLSALIEATLQPGEYVLELSYLLPGPVLVSARPAVH